MPYVKTTWVDRLVQYSNRYTKSGETSGEVTLVPSPGTVTAAGTPISAANLNKIEQGIEDLEDGLVTHEALQTAHGAVSSPTANKMMIRDANGRAQVSAPSAAADIARKDTVDTHANLTAPHSATSAATASRLMMRDASGRSKVAAPSATDDIARKLEVDTVQANLSAHMAEFATHVAEVTHVAGTIYAYKNLGGF